MLKIYFNGINGVLKPALFCGSLLLIFSTFLHAQDIKYKVACIAFYNLENFYDTIDDPNFSDEEFTPTGPYKWNTAKFQTKLDHFSQVISQVGEEYTKGGPVLLGVCEVENDQVLDNIINTPALKNSGYQYVHYDSRYYRGVDVALIYRSQYFKVTASRAVPLIKWDDSTFTTRDQLVVTGLFDGEPLTVIVNHWPSRRGGAERSAPMRAAAGDLCRALVDSVRKANPAMKVIVMGDLNDDPTDVSINEHLKAVGDKDKAKNDDLYNPMYKMFKKDGIGSLAYADRWNLFDQIILSGNLLGDDKSTYKFLQAKVFNKNFLKQKEGSFGGYPLRTYVGTNYVGGYSDHFPAYIFIVKESK